MSRSKCVCERERAAACSSLHANHYAPRDNMLRSCDQQDLEADTQACTPQFSTKWYKQERGSPRSPEAARLLEHLGWRDTSAVERGQLMRR